MNRLKLPNVNVYPRNLLIPSSWKYSSRRKCWTREMNVLPSRPRTFLTASSLELFILIVLSDEETDLKGFSNLSGMTSLWKWDFIDIFLQTVPFLWLILWVLALQFWKLSYSVLLSKFWPLLYNKKVVFTNFFKWRPWIVYWTWEETGPSRRDIHSVSQMW